MDLDKTPPPPPPPALQPPTDFFQKLIGSFGKYQFWLCFFIFLSKFAIAFHQLAIVYLAPKVTYKCPDTQKQTCPCSNPEFDKTIFQNTITMQWFLICERKWMASFQQTIFQSGTLIGSILFGILSDKYGRKMPMLVAVVIQVFIGIVSAFIKLYWLFTFLRFVIGVTVGGTMVIGFVIIMEFIGPEYRDVVSALYQAPFVMGTILLPMCGYFFRNYRDFQLSISIPTIVMLSYLCVIPETPRWLLAAHRTEDTIKIMEKVAGVNNLPKDDIRPKVEAYAATLVNTTIVKGSVRDLFRTPNIRKYTIAMASAWLACSYCYYGVSQYVGHLAGDVFVNQVASGFVVLLGTFAAIPMLKYVGRKIIVVVAFFVCFVCLFILAVVPSGIYSVAMACIGMMTSFIVFLVIYLYCSELFPTVVRNAAMGFSSMCARIGSMIAPFVIDLNDVADWLPPIIFGAAPFIAAILVLKLLPETKGRDLMTTIEEAEQFESNPAPSKSS